MGVSVVLSPYQKLSLVREDVSYEAKHDDGWAFGSVLAVKLQVLWKEEGKVRRGARWTR